MAPRCDTNSDALFKSAQVGGGWVGHIIPIPSPTIFHLTFERAARILPDIHQQFAKMAPAAAPASDVQQMHLWALSPREMTQLERGLW